MWGKLSGTTPWLFAIWGDDPSVWLYRVDNHSLHRDKLGGGDCVVLRLGPYSLRVFPIDFPETLHPPLTTNH